MRIYLLIFSATAAIIVYTRMTSDSVNGHYTFISFTITTFIITISRRYMAEILRIRRKTLSNQSINQSINQSNYFSLINFVRTRVVIKYTVVL